MSKPERTTGPAGATRRERCAAQGSSSSRRKGNVAALVVATALLSACTSVGVEEGRSPPGGHDEISRAFRFRVAEVSAVDMSIEGDGDWDQERNATERGALAAQLRAGVEASLRALELRVALLTRDEALAGDMIVVEGHVIALDRGSAMDRIGRSSLTCRFRLLRGPERREASAFTITSRAQVPSNEVAEHHTALVIEQFVDQVVPLLD